MSANLELPFVKGSPTSKAAAESLQGVAVTKMRRKMLEYIAGQGNHGSTCDQAEVALGMSHQTASARIYDLHKMGAIVDSGMTRLTRSKRKAVVYVLLVAGVA